ncbi:MAG: protease inhibitor I42 family protein [Gammaproteobacteria bacterium]|nr:protease inhibitor I42 family protein [Gammaproteobacteria bacterium]
MHFVKCILVLALFFNVSAFGQAPKKAIPVYLEEKPAVMVMVDQPQFVIKLKSNATTGFSWFLREYNSAIIEPVSHEFEAPTDKKLMGAPGYELWTFRVKPNSFIVPQQTMIRFVYSRPWEIDDGSSQLVFKVTVAEAPKKAVKK